MHSALRALKYIEYINGTQAETKNSKNTLKCFIIFNNERCTIATANVALT